MATCVLLLLTLFQFDQILFTAFVRITRFQTFRITWLKITVVLPIIKIVKFGESFLSCQHLSSSSSRHFEMFSKKIQGTISDQWLFHVSARPFSTTRLNLFNTCNLERPDSESCYLFEDVDIRPGSLRDIPEDVYIRPW